MKLPNGTAAVVDDQKLLGYILNPLHRDGRKHAEFFKRLLDIDLTKPDLRRQVLLEAAANEDAWPGKTSVHGEKFEIRFSMTGPRGSYTILSIWMIRRGEVEPRLVTAYIE